MAIRANRDRYQVLYKATPPKTGVEYVNCATKPVAQREARRLRKEGKLEVQIWDTLSNPLSDMFKL